MRNKTLKESVRVLLLAGACGVVIWHVFSWQSAGKYDDMYAWLTGGKGYLTVFYNVGLMLVFGLLLGLLMSRLMEALVSLNNRDSHHKK